MADCPNCQSSNTKTKAMVWASGSRSSRGNYSGASVSTSGRVSLSGGGGGSTSQSHLAAACAPPKDSYVPKIIVFLAFFIVVMPFANVFLQVKNPITSLLGFGVIIGGIWGLHKLYKHLNKSNIQMLEDYSKTWLCLRCGEQFKKE